MVGADLSGKAEPHRFEPRALIGLPTPSMMMRQCPCPPCYEGELQELAASAWGLGPIASAASPTPTISKGVDRRMPARPHAVSAWPGKIGTETKRTTFTRRTSGRNANESDHRNQRRRPHLAGDHRRHPVLRKRERCGLIRSGAKDGRRKGPGRAPASFRCALAGVSPGSRWRNRPRPTGRCVPRSESSFGSPC
jgi:hypothetical protein